MLKSKIKLYTAMFKPTALLISALLFSVMVISQQNPKIKADDLFGKNTDRSKSIKQLKTAEKYYKKGIGTFDEALKYYLKLHNLNQNHSALNYKIAACYLWSSDKKKALKYILNSKPQTAKDYYLLLGKAYQYNYKYAEAREAFEKHFELQNKWNRKEKLEQLMQQKRECNFGQIAIKDSIPVSIVNLGPIVNTYYDEYGAIFVPKDSILLFTSRRPHNEPDKKVSRFKFNEQIMRSNYNLKKNPPVVFSLSGLNKTVNNAVAGYNEKQNLLYYYKGKKRTGDIHSAVINKNKTKKHRNLNGKVNHLAYKETSITTADDGTTYFISNRRGGQGGKDIWQCKKKGKNRFVKRKNLGRFINSAFDEECVYVTPDGNTLYFSSNGHEGMGGFDVFKCEKQATGKWGKPINMGHPINSPSDELFYRETSNPDIALYAAIRAGGMGGLDIYKIVTDNSIPFSLSGIVSDKKTGKNLHATVQVINADDDSIVFSAASDSVDYKYLLTFKDKGNYLIQVDANGYKSLTDSIVCPAQRDAEIVMDFELEKLKSPFTISGYVRDSASFAPLMATISVYDTKNGKLLARQVTNELNGKYSVTLADKYDIKMIVTSPNHFEKKDSINTKLIGRSSLIKKFDLSSTITTYTLSGKVVSEENSPIAGAKLLFYQTNSLEPFSQTTSNTEGIYKLNIEESTPFIVEVMAEEYFFYSDTVAFENTDSLNQTKDFSLTKMKKGAKIVVKNILFNTGKTTLKTESFGELDKLVHLLSENPSIKIEVSGHTDNTGSAAVNKKLSKARALSVRNYLINKGIMQERLTYEGYGFDQPIAPNNTAEGRAQNRRVEIKVIE